MIKSEMFRTAHAMTKADILWDKTSMYPENKPYAYYFRLHLLNMYAQAKPVVMGARMERELMTDGRL